MMKQKDFHFWMHAVDDDLLEEARKPAGRRGGWIGITAGLAACLVLAALGRGLVFPGTDRNPAPETASPEAVMSLYGEPAADPEDPSAAAVKMINPVSPADMEELTELGYRMPLPEGASEAEWSLIRTGGTCPMGQVDFRLEGTAYTCRALRDTQPQDISGIYDQWDRELQWQDGKLQLQLCTRETGQGWIGWYDADLRIQWCLSSGDDGPALTETARIILENLGYELTSAPADH